MKLNKTTGVIESLLLSIALIMPLILFMTKNIYIIAYVFSCFFILFGIMCQIFQNEPIYTSFIMNTIKTKVKK